MEIKMIQTVPMGENIYIVSINDKALIIDPGGEEEQIVHYLEENDLKPQMILLTHGHGDHIYAADDLRKRYKIPIVAHMEEKEILNDYKMNWSEHLVGRTELDADIYVTEASEMDFEGETISFIHTPGHTKGGMCIKIDDTVFVGDTLFKMSVGRTDLPTGSMRQILHSIRKIVALPDDTVLLPGHGPATTAKFERENNTFITRFEKK